MSRTLKLVKTHSEWTTAVRLCFNGLSSSAMIAVCYR